MDSGLWLHEYQEYLNELKVKEINLIQQISGYLNQEDFFAKANMISAYQLKEILENRLKPISALYNLEYINSLEDEMNKNLENKKFKVTAIKKSPFINLDKLNLVYNKKSKKFYLLCIESNNESVSITISYDNLPTNCKSKNDFMKITKRIDSDEFHFDKGKKNNLFEKFIEANYEVLMELFTRVEQHVKLFNSSFICHYHDENKKEPHFLNQYIKNISDVTFFDELFKVRFFITASNDVHVILYLIGEWELFYNKIVNDMINNHRDEILKKIPIDISLLNGLISKIVEEHFSEPVIKLEKKEE